MTRKGWPFVVLIVILLLQFLLWRPFLDIPLSADEGAYAVIGQGILRGQVPYRDFFDHKPPGAHFLYALAFKLFGDSQATIRVLTLCFSFLSTLAVFAIGSLFWGSWGGLFSAFLYALFSGGPYIQGTSANTETFMVLPMLLALYCFLRAGKRKMVWLFLAGLFSGLAVMLKQVAFLNFLVLLGFAFLLPFHKTWKGKKAAGIVLGFAIFPALFILYFWSKGVLSDFIFQVFKMNYYYFKASPVPVFFFDPRYGLSEIFRIAFWENSLLWVFGLSGLIYIFLRDRKPESLLLAFWAIFSFVGVALGRNFFPHYFIQLIPALALLSVYSMVKWKEEKPDLFHNLVAGMIVVFLLIAMIYFHLDFYINPTPQKISEKMYNTEEYSLARAVSVNLSKELKPADMILVWNRVPQIYFYTKSRPVIPFVYYLLWFDEAPQARGWKDKMLERVRKTEPKFVVWTQNPIPFSELRNFVKRNYRLIKKEESWEIFEWQR